MTVAVTGAAGQLGAAIVEAFRPAHDVTALTHADLDITNPAEVGRALRRLAPAVIVNCAAFNDVDGAEKDAGRALEVNALAVLALAGIARDTGATLVHFGSDFVFDGLSDRPYLETDPPRPKSMYGCSKLLGEMFARDAPRHYVLRVESLFGGPTAGRTAREGALGSIVRRLRAGDEVSVFTDRTVSPTYAPDAALAVRRLLDAAAEPGLYHCVNRGAATWETVAREAARVAGIDARLRPITMEDIPLVAARPRYCALDPGKLARAGVVMPSWQDAVRRWLAR